MADSLFDELEEAPAFTRAPSAEESLRLTQLGRELAGVDAEISALEDVLAEKKSRRNAIAMDELPRYMVDIGQDRLGLPDFDVDLVLEPYYHCNIAADWPEEDRQKAFDYLISLGEGDLIKVIVTYSFGRSQMDDALWMRRTIAAISERINAAANIGIQIPEPDIRQGVHPSTMGAWFRNRMEGGEEVDLGVLKATVGKVVKLKPRSGKVKKNGKGRS